MVDVDRRIPGLNPSHIAGLRRLSARAAAPSLSSPSPTSLSFTALANKLITHLKKNKIKIEPGLPDPEFARAEAEFGFVFPPDLKAVLSLALPVGPGFPNWRCTGSGRAQLQALIDLPVASVSFHISRNALWSKSWGPRPSDPEKAMKIARNCLKRAPLLIPVFNHCYIPCSPSLAGNPVFYVDENRIFCCGFDLSDFFNREYSFFSSGSSNISVCLEKTKIPRWIDFWGDAASDKKRRNSNSSASSSSPDRVFELTRSREPKWIEDYLATIGTVLKKGGWLESEVDEMVQVTPSGFFEDEMVFLDKQAVLDALLLKTDRFSDSLRKAGWSFEEVSDALGFDFQPEKEKKMVKKLSPEIVEKFGKLAQAVSRS